jgi:glycerol-3-phosphate acyltransferase PlsY
MPASAPSPEWLVPAIAIGAYALGSISPGWWLVRRKAGIDLRTEGSGATGATNAARILGKRAYVLVMALDTMKGAVALLGARLLAPHSPWAALAAPAVVAGHIWPVWLKFKGGRGAATLMGDCLAFHWGIVAGAFAPALLAGLIARKGIAFRVVAFIACLPIGLWLLPGLPDRVSLTAAWCMVLLAHRRLFGKHFSR